MSNVSKAFLDNFKHSFDLADLISPEAKALEDEFTGLSVFKYSPVTRREFFKRPQLRFTQKTDLNDPFELTRRWEQFGSPLTRTIITNYVREPIIALMQSAEVIADLFCEKLTELGMQVDRQLVLEKLQSAEGRAFLSERLVETEAMISVVMEMVLNQMSEQSDSLIDGLVRKMGILSLSATAISQPMWALYASSGAGFVVHYKARHEFFLGSPNGSPVSLLRKVYYTNERIEDFWNNPFYLFAVKETEWSAPGLDDSD